MPVELFAQSDAARFADALDLRLRVFVGEQGVPPEEEEDAHDAAAGTVHALAILDGKRVGAARFYEAEPGVAQVGRMAVLREARGLGLGRALLEALLAEAWARGYGTVRLLAQLHAVPFYARFGFAPLPGPEILDGGILHRTMELRRSAGVPPARDAL